MPGPIQRDIGDDDQVLEVRFGGGSPTGTGGDVDGATSQGEMLAAGDNTQSGAYVALEKVSGKLHGCSGSFVLVHRALMVGGTPQEWTITVAPESGTGELTGLGGAMTITLAGGKHGYDFNFTLPGRRAVRSARAGLTRPTKPSEAPP